MIAVPGPSVPTVRDLRWGPSVISTTENSNPNLIQISPLKVASPQQTNEPSVLEGPSERAEDVKVKVDSGTERSSPKDEFAPIPVISRNKYPSKIKTTTKLRSFSGFSSLPVVSHPSPALVVSPSPSVDASDVSFNINSVTVPIVSSSHHSESSQASNLIPANDIMYSSHNSEAVAVQSNPPNVVPSVGHGSPPVLFASATMIPGKYFVMCA